MIPSEGELGSHGNELRRADDGSRMKLRVKCYSGPKADERPVRFQLDDREYLVEELLDQWHGRDDTFFKVRADDGNLYILRHKLSVTEDTWSLEAPASRRRLF